MMARELLIREYEELRDFATAFAKGFYELLVVVGDAGTGKSQLRRLIQRLLGDKWGLLRGYHAELALYKKLYRYRYYPIVMDDIDSLFEGSIKTGLLKSVCDTNPVKCVEWDSTHRAFDEGLPNTFESISRVMIVANDLKKMTKDLGAILDRGMVVRFQPTALNLHVEVAAGGWFDDNEVFREIGKYLYLMVHPSFRFYVTTRTTSAPGWTGSRSCCGNWRKPRTTTCSSSPRRSCTTPATRPRRSRKRRSWRTRTGAPRRRGSERKGNSSSGVGTSTWRWSRKCRW